MADVYNPYAPNPNMGAGQIGGGMPAQSFGGMLASHFGGPSYGNAARGIVQQGGAAGYFNPMGSPQLLAAVRQMALRNSRNQLHRGAFLSQLLGLDPQQARAAQLGFEQNAGNNISNALLNAGTQQLTGAQDWIRQLFGQGLQGEQAQAIARMQAQAQKDANRAGMYSDIGKIGASLLPLAF